MHIVSKLIATGAAGFIALGIASALAENDRGHRRDRAPISVSDQVNDEYRRGGRMTRRNWRQDHYVNHNQVVSRRTFYTQYQAKIVLTEEVVRTRRGPSLICTVEAFGPQADYVSKGRLRRVARNNCSRRSRIQILA